MEATMSRDDGMIDETSARLNTHEAVCAERYGQILNRFDDGSKKMKSMETKIEGLENKAAKIGGGIAVFIVFVQVAVEIWRAFHG